MLQKDTDEHGGPRLVFLDLNYLDSGHLLITGFHTISYFSCTSISECPEPEQALSEQANQ